MPAYGQNPGDYRSIANGNYDNIGIWQVYDGSTWQAAVSKPNRDHDVYIENPHTIVLSGNEEVGSLYLNRDNNAGEKINLNNFALEVFGSLNAYEGNTNAPYSVTGAGAFNPSDWIGSSVNSRIIFRGNSRTVIRAGWWSAQSTNSRYSVIFDPGPGVELTVERPFKANRFIIRSGKVIQKVFGMNECASFSFNTNVTVFGSGPYGQLIIEPNATLESECSAGITFRSASGSVPSALFDLQEGGNLVLLGNNPRIESADVRFDGAVYYMAASGNQQFITASMAGTMVQNRYHHLFFQNNALKNLPATLQLTGNFTFLGGGNVIDNNTFIRFEGAGNQSVNNMSLQVTAVEVDKLSGILFFDQDLHVKTNFTMRQGILDFQNNQLFINTQLSGDYLYQGGSWRNLSQLHYHHLPTNLTASNASFPFEDRYEDGIRMVQLLGTHGDSGKTLVIRYNQVPQVNWDPNFNDNDGTPILYKLNSHFDFSGNLSGTDDLELRISADELIVVDVGDLRIVDEGMPASGTHLAGLDQGVFWARRTVSFDQLLGTSATVGSTGIFSILPLTWINFEANQEHDHILIKWEIAQEMDIEKYLLLKSVAGVGQFEVIAAIPSQGFSENVQSYRFRDMSPTIHPETYYQLHQMDIEGQVEMSHVIRAKIQAPTPPLHEIKIYPNPYSGGRIGIRLPEGSVAPHSSLLIFHVKGVLMADLTVDESLLEEKLLQLPKGKYIILLSAQKSVKPFIWVKK